MKSKLTITNDDITELTYCFDKRGHSELKTRVAAILRKHDPEYRSAWFWNAPYYLSS